ncbi:unnamed protein product [Peniophora sp. CBMAI 1063]|nr:unnamed protein product [Peniophora sp. CBMAI 1063]
MSEMTDSQLPVLGPQRASRPGSLYKEIHLRIHLDGCKGLPQSRTLSESSASRKFHVGIWYILGRDDGNSVYSSHVYEGTGCLRGTVQWDETLYITCLEHSLVRIALSEAGYGEICECVCIAGDLTQVPSVSLKPTSWTHFLYDTNTESTLFLSVSVVSADCGDENCEFANASSMVFERDYVPSESQSPASSWEVAFRGLSSFAGATSRANIASNAYAMCWTQRWIYKAYQTRSTRQSDHPQIDNLLKILTTAVNTCVQVQDSRVLHRRDCIEQITTQLNSLAILMEELAGNHDSGPTEYREEELARLVVILVSPDPFTGVTSTSTGGDWTALFGTVAKDALLFTLEGIVQSSDAFPPLKSAASGLLFFATSADMASSNKKHIRDIHKRVNSLAASLKRGAAEGSMLAPAHQDAISALAADISALKDDLESIVNERKSRFRRYFSAKRHREELQDIVWQLDNARSNYTTAVATLNATTNAQVLAHVRALTVVMGVNPIHLPGTRPVDAVSFPFGSSRIEEVGA